MTIKEIADFTKKTERTIRNWANKATEKISVITEKISVSSPMNPADYTLEEVEQILLAGSMGENTVSILMENARLKDKLVLNNQGKSKIEHHIFLAENSLNALKEMYTDVNELKKDMRDVKECVTGLVNSVDKKAILLSAPPKSLRATLNRHILNYIKQEGADRREVWKKLYEEVKDRIHIDVYSRVEGENTRRKEELIRQGKKKAKNLGKVNCMDILEMAEKKEQALSKTYAIATVVFPVEGVIPIRPPKKI